MAEKPAATADEKGSAAGLTRRLARRVAEHAGGLRRAIDATLDVALDAVRPPPSPDQVQPAPSPEPASKSRRGSEKRQRGKSVLVRFADEEFLLVETAASNTGLTVPSYTRAILLGEKLKTKSRNRPPIERELLARLLGQYGKIGSNLNQIAHAANLGELPGKELEAALAELRVLNAQTMRALGRKP